MALVRHALALLALAILAGCKGPAADGYKFEGAEYERAHVTLRIVTHDDLPSLRLAALGAGAQVEQGREIMAWSLISGDRATCTVHVVNPRRSYAPEWLGHELAHCIYGRWHR